MFALPAVRSIDILGRRKWLIATLPVMSICMLGAALSFTISDANSRDGVLAFFLFSTFFRCDMETLILISYSVRCRVLAGSRAHPVHSRF